MARIRTIKPEFWTDERLADCSLTARLLLIASLNFADDYGNLERSARQLKAQAFPYDQLECEPLVRELLHAGLMVEYKVADRLYLHIKGFQKHQRIEKKSEPRLPQYEESLRTPQTVGEDSRTPPGVVTVLREGKGRESKGKDQRPTAHRTAPTAIEPPAEFLDFKIAYPNRAGDQGWRKALRAAHARIEEGYSWTEMVEGARRYELFARSTGIESTEFVKQAATFLGPDLFFLQSWDPPKTKAANLRDSNIENSQEWLHATQ